jgi:ribonuclease VapC
MDEASAVLDSSALLAWLHLEPGALIVRAALDKKAAMSAVNWAEVLTKLADLGQNPDAVSITLLNSGLFKNDLILWPLDEGFALDTARLRVSTRSTGLSLGDRACIALGQRLRLPILTADRAWKNLRLGVRVRLIR